MNLKYPYRNPLFRFLNLLVRVAPAKSKYVLNGVLMKKNLDNLLPTLIAGQDYIFGWAGQEELNFIMNHPETNMPEAFSRRLEAGNRCFYAKYDNEVIAFNWVNFKFGCVLFGRENELTFFHLDENSAFTYDLYTYSKYRRQGIGLQMKAHQFRHLKEMGINIAYTFISLSNIKSLGLHAKLGSTPERLIYCYKLGRWKKGFLGTEGEKKRLKEWAESFVTDSKAAKSKRKRFSR